MTRILVVDDEAVMRAAVARVLRQAGYEVVEAGLGEEGLRLARQQPPDLVLMDVNLPDMSGVEAARLIKGDPALQGSFVVNLSSHMISPEEQAQGLDAGADGYIVRPIGNRELLARVNAFLRLKQVTDALRRSEAQTRLLLDQSADGILVLKPVDGEILFANPRAASLLARSAAELVGTAFGHAVDRCSTVEIELDRRDGESNGGPLIAELRASRCEWQGTDATLVSLHDVTAMRLAARRLEASEQRYRSLFEQNPDAVYSVDRDGRIVEANTAYLQMTGLAAAEVVGMDFLRAVAPEHLQTAVAHFQRALLGEPVRYESVRMHKDGSRIAVDVIYQPIVVDAAITGVYGIAKDITERLRAQEALRELNGELVVRVLARTEELQQARLEAEQANRAKSVFIATMSHEIRTPMNGVIGMLDVLHQSSLKPHQAEMLEVARESAFSLLGIIEDILDFSRIEAGRLQLESLPMALEGTVETACAMLAPLAVKQGVRLTAFVDPDIPAVLLGDVTRLRQVLVNLVGNAIKFSGGREQPGAVVVRVLPVAEAANPSGTVVVDLIVSDNGIGMDDATQARLFVPFAQADASTTRRFGGTGLGLAITGSLVQLMGGVLSLRSAPGQGSTFTVRLHFALPADGGPAAANPPISLAGVNCRVVGSEQPLAADLGCWLRDAGAHVDASPDLRSAGAAHDQGECAGLTVWVVLPSVALPDLAELRRLAGNQRDVPIRLVVLGWGQRRQPRVEAPDLVLLDADALGRRTLLSVLARAAGPLPPADLDGDASADEAVQGAASRAPSREQAQRQGRLVLVAEDNAANRTVILSQLHLLGLAADVAVDGRDALERWRRGNFALLLTDLQMPEMDGYALAAAIRAEETANPAHPSPRARLPIVALTANAQRDEMRRCLAVGIDACLTKPVRLPELKEAIEAWMLPAAAAVEAAAAAMDLGALQALVGDDPLVIAQVLQAFRDSAEHARADMRQGVASGSLQRMATAAHSLKPGARSIGALALVEACASVESAAAAGRPQAAGAAALATAAELTRLVSQFEAALDGVLRSLPAAAVAAPAIAVPTGRR